MEHFYKNNILDFQSNLRFYTWLYTTCLTSFSTLAIILKGEGSVFPKEAIKLLLNGFESEQNRLEGFEGVSAEYTASSSREGIEALKENPGKTVDFALSDVPLTDDDFASNPGLQVLPLFAR